MKKNIIEVHGIRRCVSCKKVIRGKALRTKTGQRKSYLCNKSCLRKHVKNLLKKGSPLIGMLPLVFPIKWFLENGVEDVLVITK